MQTGPGSTVPQPPQLSSTNNHWADKVARPKAQVAPTGTANCGNDAPYQSYPRLEIVPELGSRPPPYRISAGSSGLADPNIGQVEKALIENLYKQVRPANTTTSAHNTTNPEAKYFQVASDFAKDPICFAARLRNILLDIAKDNSQDKASRFKNMCAYYDASVLLLLRVERQTYSYLDNDPTVRKGVHPSFIPDRFVDMGRNGSKDPGERDREMPVVDKGALYAALRPAILSAIWNATENGDPKVSNNDAAARLAFIGASYLATELQNENPFDGAKCAVGLHHYVLENKAKSNQLTLTYQLINQFWGIESQHVRFRQHYSNADRTSPSPKFFSTGNIVCVNGNYTLVTLNMGTENKAGSIKLLGIPNENEPGNLTEGKVFEFFTGNSSKLVITVSADGKHYYMPQEEVEKLKRPRDNWDLPDVMVGVPPE